ncbi:tRNA(Thr) (cytosine(32)-N(3))-methyltransferase [Escovopsis weberi]|uniref:tRNA N(3)-methylcytidine methyltransferase n=1 Tax=Escovopsis weberi TaxID=150374 RepID=A0A0M8N250_ESCWE|nr:tRNA(Thr) (cytosine(32)-N(3))-methyltransferase [Escovopsis weberi]
MAFISLEVKVPEAQALSEDMASLKIEDQAETTAEAAAEVPPHRSHNPSNNLKRSDPFQFGSRYLEAGDDVFEFNAWDHVETDDAYKLFNGNPSKWWNQFYKNNTSNFFKDRKWLQQEFPILEEVTKEDAGPKLVLEIGAGAGNTAFPVLARNKNSELKIHACDFSKTAVEVMRKHESYDPKHIQADVWDVAGEVLPPDVEEGTVDVAIMIFIFSALSPKEWGRAVRNVHRVLKPGGLVCFRDYGRGDLAQVRFRKGRYLEENFYIRGDGTRVYFFDRDELAGIWSGQSPEKPTGTEGQAEATEAEPIGLESESTEHQSTEDQSTETMPADSDSIAPGFIVEDLGVDRRLLVNRAEKIKMYRCWLQGRFRKK